MDFDAMSNTQKAAVALVAFGPEVSAIVLKGMTEQELETITVQIANLRDVPPEIEEKVIAIVAEQMGVDKGEISRETSFVNDLNADSLDTVELVMEFEDEFETSIPDEEAEKIDTVGRAIAFIKENYGG